MVNPHVLYQCAKYFPSRSLCHQVDSKMRCLQFKKPTTYARWVYSFVWNLVHRFSSEIASCDKHKYKQKSNDIRRRRFELEHVDKSESQRRILTIQTAKLKGGRVGKACLTKKQRANGRDERKMHNTNAAFVLCTSPPSRPSSGCFFVRIRCISSGWKETALVGVASLATAAAAGRCQTARAGDSRRGRCGPGE